MTVNELIDLLSEQAPAFRRKTILVEDLDDFRHASIRFEEQLDAFVVEGVGDGLHDPT
jgi:hypothetical protein